MHASTRPPDRTSSAWLVVFLLCALVIAAVLAYQAQDAARSHRDTAERILVEYAALAGEQFAHHGEMTLTAMQMMSLRLPVSLEGTAAADSLPSAAAFRREALELTAWCRCLDAGATFFRLDRRDGGLEAAGGRALTVQPWLADVAGTEAAPAPERFAFGRAAIRDDRVAPYAFHSRRSEIVIGTVGGASRAMLYYHVHDADERPLAVYGYEADPDVLVGPLFRRILDNTPLLPRTLLGELSNDSVLVIIVTDREGNEVFRSAAAEPSVYLAADTLAAPWQDLVVRASLRPEVAGRLIIGGLPSSRLPLLLALLGLTAALVVGALVQLHRHQELVRTRSDFVAGVSHELRTPLTQIRLYADLLRSGRLGPENRERSVRVIDQEARRLSHLVENVLRFSAAGGDALEVRPEPRVLAPLVREILDDFAPLARVRRAALHAELDEEVRAAVDADAVRQMLLNLLDNAVKYGPAGQRVDVGLERRGGAVRLRVDDQSAGVPEPERERVWDAYRRLDAAIASGMGGSGIGLSLVRELAARHGGRAWVTDAPGGGARFVIELPALGATRRSPEPEMETA